MKNLLLLLFAVMCVACKQDTMKVGVNNSSIVKETETSNDPVRIEESSAADFETGAINVLKGVFKTNFPSQDTILNPPVIVNTQNRKLVFENVNPYVQKDRYDEDTVEYYNMGYSKLLNKHLVYGSFYEFESYFLIDHASAKIDTLNGIPDFSPDRKRLISYYINPYYEGNEMLDVEIYESKGDDLTSLHKASYDYIPCDIRWKGNDTILIKALPWTEYYETQIKASGDKKVKHFIYKKIILK